MKALIFIVILIAVILLIPDSLVGNLINVSGDGETAMDTYEFTILLIKAAIAGIIAGAVLWILPRLR